ncbi:hypothetical protein ABKA04_006870 [Annulohypoxylon sp. FPYF3050]
MAQTTKDELEQLNALHLSYLDQLRQNFQQQFSTTVSQGRQYWEDFLAFVRLQIFPSFEVRPSAAYKPPFEVVSEFKEWKIAQLEKEISSIKLAQPKAQKLATATTITPEKSIHGFLEPQSDSIWDTLKVNNRPKTDATQPEPFKTPKGESERSHTPEEEFEARESTYRPFNTYNFL